MTSSKLFAPVRRLLLPLFAVAAACLLFGLPAQPLPQAPVTGELCADATNADPGASSIATFTSCKVICPRCEAAGGTCDRAPDGRGCICY